MDPWHVVELLCGALLALGLAVLKGMYNETQARVHAAEARITSLEAAAAALRADHARSDERDKAFEKGIERLTKAIDDFDTKVGARIDELARVVGYTRKMSPPGGFRHATIPREDKDR